MQPCLGLTVTWLRCAQIGDGRAAQQIGDGFQSGWGRRFSLWRRRTRAIWYSSHWGADDGFWRYNLWCLGQQGQLAFEIGYVVVQVVGAGVCAQRVQGYLI